jgi:hypothetical protein
MRKPTVDQVAPSLCMRPAGKGLVIHPFGVKQVGSVLGTNRATGFFPGHKGQRRAAMLIVTGKPCHAAYP